MQRHKDVVMFFAGLTDATVAVAHCGLFTCIVVRLMWQTGVKYYEVLVRTNTHASLGFFRDCDVPTVSQQLAVVRHMSPCYAQRSKFARQCGGVTVMKKLEPTLG
ncbi:hypothetical protein Tco_0662842 [Tanacetum coccineum]